MRRLSLVGLAVALFAGSASAQQIVNVTTIKDCKQKITVIEKLPPGVIPGHPKLDQISCAPPHCPGNCTLNCLLADQPALLARLANYDRALETLSNSLVPRPEALPRPKPVDDKKPMDDKKPVEDKKPADVKRVEDRKGELPFPATMLTLNVREWQSGSSFVDDCDRHWCLIKGCPLPVKMEHMRGWLLESDAKKMYFLHETGSIYARTTTATLP